LSEPAEHHRSVKYRIRDYALLTSFRVTPLAGGRQIEVTGICPGCGGRTSTIWTYGSGNSYKGIIRRSYSQSRPEGARTVCCDCGHSHADRSEDAVFLGCGAFWQVELPGEH
jgi:hypothetical protein